MIKNVLNFFDKLEDRLRKFLSHFPIFYAVLGAIGTVLLWRGVWHTADYIAAIYLPVDTNAAGTINFASPVDGIISAVLGLALLLVSGLFVATFIGDHIIMSGLKGEKKLAERTEAEVKGEASMMRKVHDELSSISKRLDNIEKKIK